MDTLTRVVLRSTLRTACKLDTRPALQALIHRDVSRDLPQDFNSVLSVFLGGPHRLFFMPSLLPGPTVVQTVRDAFRFPPGPPNIDSGLLGMRFLTSILQMAEKHGLHPKVQPVPHDAMHQTGPQVRPQALPEQACLLVSHPLLYHPTFNFFYQTVTLICQHGLTSGAYGLVLNKLMSREAKAMWSRPVGTNCASPQRQPGWSQPEANLDLARDLPAALQAFLDTHGQSESGDPVMIDLQELSTQAGYSSPSGSESQTEADSSDSDSETIAVMFSTSESSPETVAGKFVRVSTDDHQQSGDQQQAPDHDDETESDDGNDFDQSRQDSWRATIKPPPVARERPDSRQSRQSRPDASGDIADPRHPFRFHQVVSSLRRSAPPMDSDPAPAQLETPQQPPGSTAEMPAQHASASSDNQQSSSQDPAQREPLSSESQSMDQQPQEHPELGGSSDGPQHAHQTSNIASQTNQAAAGKQAATGTKLSGESLHRRISKLSGALDEIEEQVIRHSQRNVPGRSRGTSIGQASHLEQDSLMGKLPALPHDSRGGPLPGRQVLHNQAELGGKVIQGPTPSTPGLYIGSDSRRAKQLHVAGKLLESELRFFAGEAIWTSGQLEQELAEGKWLLLSPQPPLLLDLAMRPLDFGNRPADDGTDDAQQAAVRQGMWKHVVAAAGDSFADLSNISKELAKDMQHLKY